MLKKGKKERIFQHRKEDSVKGNQQQQEKKTKDKLQVYIIFGASQS